jgi:serine phosphatase RsbU (regulator of sigma subunit)/pSer/pThr/pTyr-binding forkhead associated (FHA) protein
MASFHVVEGANEGQTIPLTTDEIIFGRDPDCQIIIPVGAVSRKHARVTRNGVGFEIEDLRSRNGTFVNDRMIEPGAKVKLKHGDRIRICDFKATFLDPTAAAEEDDEDEPPSSTTIEAKLSSSSAKASLDSHPAEKLSALLEITNNLCTTLQLESLLPKIGDNLFQLFRQADRCFIILSEPGVKDQPPRLLPKLVKTRRARDEATARFSKTIVRGALDTAEAVLLDDAGVQMASQSVVDFRIRSVMCAPLTDLENKSFGVIQLDTQDRSKKFTKDDLRLLNAVARQASIALENARLHERVLQQELVRKDMDLARKVQLGFLPTSVPSVPGYEFFSFYEPAREVGGDYYGFMELRDGKWAVLLGDVAGKGVPAALMVAKLAAEARFCFMLKENPAVAFSALNEAVYENASKTDRFVTLAAAIIDPASHTVSLVNAGHPAPLYYRRADKSLEPCMPRKAAGLALGIMQGQDYSICPLQLEPGDSLVLYSDGVSESQNIKGQELTLAGMSAAMKAGGPNTAKVLGERVVRAVHQHAAGRAPHDDVTLVCFGRAT